MMKLQNWINVVAPLDAAAMWAARQRQAQLAQPPGSLGRLGDLSSQLAGITGKIQNSVSRQHLLVFAADNGVVAEGVSSKNKNRYEWQPKNGCGYVLRNGTYKSLSRIITNSCIWMETRRPMWE